MNDITTKIHKNVCSGCGFNFATQESFNKHRIGKFREKRRCLTPDEMGTQGWIYCIPTMVFFNNGTRYTKPTPTWIYPDTNTSITDETELDTDEKE
jgi:hypothetical protein